jgi:ATP-dependent DNA helicase RecQ
MSDKINETLISIFGHTSFRPKQEEIIRAIVDRRDVLAILPTGAGKSLCFQLPAVVMTGMTIVISPLIALMQDQVKNAREKGINAQHLSSLQDESESVFVHDEIKTGNVKLIYISPERFIMESFQEELKSILISLVILDEAHCIEYGNEFRPAYFELSERLKNIIYQDVPRAAFTASATEETQKVIIEKFGLYKPEIFKTTFNRPNLFYEVREKTGNGIAYLPILISAKHFESERGIIYCSTRSKCEEAATLLNRDGYKAVPYHAGMDSQERTENQRAFVSGEIKIICATIAFGMGIDVPDIRYVIHLDLSKNMEGFYQETGRAGRDGLPSYCCLFYDRADKLLIKRFNGNIEDEERRNIASKQLEYMAEYAEVSVCRRKKILEYFGEPYPSDNCGKCDVCTGTRTTAQKITYTKKELFKNR